ncbi:MAG: TlpA family protein disulfide reductase [Mucilaginibacter sp.]
MLVIILNLFCKGDKRSPDAKKQALGVTVSFKLKKNEKCIFNYTNSFFEGNLLTISNPGSNDSVIVKTIATNSPVSLIYNLYVLKKDNQIRPIRYTLLGLPGDTLHLSYSNKAYLNTTECRRRNVLSDSTTLYYTDDTFLPAKNSATSKKAMWESFYQTFSKKYNREIERISGLLYHKEIDTVSYQRLTINCKLHYYKRLLDWVFEKDGGYFKPCLPVILEKMPEIEQILNNDNLFLSNELLDVMDGVVLVKIIYKGKNYTNEVNAYQEAAAVNLGKYKPAYLTVCIAKSPVKIGPGFGQILSDYRSRYKNSVYLSHIDSVLKRDGKVKRLVSNDPLTTLTGNSVSWNKLVKSKKKFLVIDFWASWCVPCRHQLPFIDSLRSVLKTYPVEFVSVNIDENADAWKTASKVEKKFLKENNYHLTNAKKSNIVNSLKINSIPRYLVLKGTEIIASDFYQPSDPSFAKELIQLMAFKK